MSEEWRLTDKRIQLFGERIRQSWVDLFFINRILSEYTFDHIIEIGTGHGMLSVFLRMHSKGNPVDTFDIRDFHRNDTFKRIQEVYTINDHFGDCFKSPFLDIIINSIQNGRTLVYCDGGDKPRELKTIAPHLKENDVIMCHDKDSRECLWEHIEETVKQNHLKPFHQKEADKLDASIWSFIKCA